MTSNKGIQRSKPHLPTNAQMFAWARDIVEITERYRQMRRLGTEGDARVRAYIMAVLAQFGVDRVEEQPFLP